MYRYSFLAHLVFFSYFCEHSIYDEIKLHRALYKLFIHHLDTT